MSEQELIDILKQDRDFRESDARALDQQVQGRDYSPPKRDRVLEWQQQQDFLICPDPDDPDACNIYRDLQFPEDIYEQISEYYEQKADS